jgi:PEP-CTERM motif-containing protein
MKRCALKAAALLAAALTAHSAAALDTVIWIGGPNGEWRDANAWRNTRTNAVGDAATILGSGNGSDGMNDINPATTRARNIVIGGGATVNYNGAVNGDFRIRQGSNLTIKEGATWVQATDATYTENIWTRFDPSNFVLDGGTFRRSGESAGGDGGGILMMSSFNDDNNLARLGPPKINVEIKNGGRLENTGQVWFGADDEHTHGTEVTWTINNGTVDLTGGTIELSNSSNLVTADLAFFYDYNEGQAQPKNEQYTINFTGPGSITVDSAGINVYRQDDAGVWTGGAAISYQDLWNQGILKANGLSGLVTDYLNAGGGTTPSQPANFSDYFTVTGAPGANNYVLTSLLPGEPALGGDFNNDGRVDGADFLVWQRGVGGAHNSATLATWKANFGQGAATAAVGTIPEPAALGLALVALGAVASARRRVG